METNCNNDPNKTQVDWTKVKTTVNKDDCRIFIESIEFQQKVLDYISSEEINKMFNSTIFKDNPECKSAMIHGMVIASMLTCHCKQFCIVEKDIKIEPINDILPKTPNPEIVFEK